MMLSRVSVIIPTYNCASYISQAVASVLAQTFQDYELIVVDDGSTDTTQQILQRYGNQITYIYQENQERSVARNTGIRASRGEYVAFLDADDVWLPQKLERQVAVLDEHPEVVLVYCQASYVDICGKSVRFRGKSFSGKPGAEMQIADRSRDLVLGNVVSGGGSTPVVRASALDEVGLFDETLTYPEDWDLWTRLSRVGPLAYIPEPLACYRVYGWHKVLSIEASGRLVEQHLRIVEKALATWNGNSDEREWLRQQAMETIYTRAALANYQLGQVSEGQSYLEKAMAADPGLLDRQRLIQLAVDRAKTIETETTSYQEAKAFLHRFFVHLPAIAGPDKCAYREAVGWLYVAGAFERQKEGDSAAVRRLLAQGIVHTPTCLKNLGVLSTALKVYLGRGVTNMLRKVVKELFKILGRPVNAQS